MRLRVSLDVPVSGAVLWHARKVNRKRHTNPGSRGRLTDEAYYAIRELILRGKLPLVLNSNSFLRLPLRLQWKR